VRFNAMLIWRRVGAKNLDIKANIFIAYSWAGRILDFKDCNFSVRQL
jgi:hypothetical protein